MIGSFYSIATQNWVSKFHNSFIHSPNSKFETKKLLSFQKRRVIIQRNIKQIKNPLAGINNIMLQAKQSEKIIIFHYVRFLKEYCILIGFFLADQNPFGFEIVIE